jgi:hypothetical protein
MNMKKEPEPDKIAQEIGFLERSDIRGPENEERMNTVRRSRIIGSSVVSLKFARKQPQILRLRLPQKTPRTPLRACDFFDFSPKPMLTMNDLCVKKSRKFKKVTNSQDDKSII